MNVFHRNSGGPAHTLTVEGAEPVMFDAGDFAALGNYVRIQVQGAAVYVTYDGTAPSASNGQLLPAGTDSSFLFNELLTMKFVPVTTAARVFAQPCNVLHPSSPLLAA